MSDKFAKASIALSENIEDVPTIHRTPKQIVERHEKEKKEPRTTKTTEREGGYLLLLRESLKDELKLEALKQKMTIKQFILDALREKGLDVTTADMVDKRKKT